MAVASRFSSGRRQVLSKGNPLLPAPPSLGSGTTSLERRRCGGGEGRTALDRPSARCGRRMARRIQHRAGSQLARKTDARKVRTAISVGQRKAYLLPADSKLAPFQKGHQVEASTGSISSMLPGTLRAGGAEVQSWCDAALPQSLLASPDSHDPDGRSGTFPLGSFGVCRGPCRTHAAQPFSVEVDPRDRFRSKERHLCSA